MNYFKSIEEACYCRHDVSIYEECASCAEEHLVEIKDCLDNGGHEYDVISDVNPDSGSEHFLCVICHDSHTITYY